MLFNSVEYLLLFLPLTVLVFQWISRASNTERQITWLVLVSVIFYGCWKPIYLLLIVASIMGNFAVGKRLHRGAQEQKRFWLILGICFNLGLLGYFKYTGFFLEGLNSIGLWLIPIPKITLPLAISFFTFQQIAYLVDVYRGDCREYQLRHYALFVLFFPQLIAGPIVHHKEMMPQFERLRPRAQVPTDLAIGLTFIAMGLFKKVVMADSLALVADPVFSAATLGSPLNSSDALLGIFAFSFQIYFDFSGYSDLAIGSARLFGIRLPENFRSPYKAHSIIEIWRRWHMTLSRFLRDYLYFPLGGNRQGSMKRYRNLLITMLLGGLWHGAAWTFVIWGGLHGIYLCINHAWHHLLNHLGLRDTLSHWAFRPLFIALTFVAWTIAFVFFRAGDVSTAWSLIDAGFINLSHDAPWRLGNVLNDLLFWQPAATVLPQVEYSQVCILMLIAALICWLLPNSQQFLHRYEPVTYPDNQPVQPGLISWKPSLGFAALTVVLLSISLLSLSTISRFLYFEF